MRHPIALLLLAPLALGAVALAARAQGSLHSARLPGTVPVRWALVLDSDRPIYAAGASLLARCTLANSSTQDAAAWTMSTGGNGCDYSIEIQDGAGNVLWEPGSIVGGNFSSPPCGFGGRQKNLPAGSQQAFSATIPLVHQNRDGTGAQGQPIPAGDYYLAVSVEWFGPMTPPADFQTGLPYEARLPFRIE